MKHMPKTHKELHKEYLEEFPFEPKLMEKELLNKTSKRLIRFGSPYNFVPKDYTKYEEIVPEYLYRRFDGNYEYECPSCGFLSMTDFKWYHEPWDPVVCKYCNKYIRI